MKTLSIRQPWAELIIQGRKTLELRTWTIKYRGPLAIHASQTVEREVCLAHGLDPDLVTAGAVIGTVDLVEIIELDAASYAAQCAEHLAGEPFPAAVGAGLAPARGGSRKGVPLRSTAGDWPTRGRCPNLCRCVGGWGCSMKTTPDNQKLLDLVADARKGKIVLPQFQRNFVWSRDDITSLLVSVLQGHFIGSFLLLRTDSDEPPFAIRAVQGVDLAANQLKPDSMILDGQQRLTSLHYVFAAPAIPLRWTKYPYRFFLDLRKVTKGEFEEAIFQRPRRFRRWETRPPDAV